MIFFLIFFSAFSFGFKPPSFNSLKKPSPNSIELRSLWTVDTVKPSKASKTSKMSLLKPSLVHNSSPLLFKNLVIQANGWDGVKAYSQKTGRLIWKLSISGGSFSPLLLHKNQLYFGASDGFFYSLQAQTGELLWKFFVGSEVLSQALIDSNSVYFISNNQKVYALSLKGKLIWSYANSFLSGDKILRTRSRPVIYKSFIYVGFYNGEVLALHKRKGTLRWKKSISQQAISGDLLIKDSCLLVSAFQSYTYCLNPRKGLVSWKSLGDQILYPKKGSLYYQIAKNNLVAYKKSNRKKIWTTSVKPYPVLASIYKKWMIYGATSSDRLYVINKKQGSLDSVYVFGSGLSAPVTIDYKKGEVYLISNHAYLHKLKIVTPQ